MSTRVPGSGFVSQIPSKLPAFHGNISLLAERLHNSKHLLQGFPLRSENIPIFGGAEME